MTERQRATTGRAARALGVAALALAASLTVLPLVGAGAASTTASTEVPVVAAPQPGLTAHTVTVGQVDTLSGPVPGLFQGAKFGTQAYFDYVNSHGGVDGRKLVLVADDDGFSAQNYATDTQQLVKTSFALVGGFSLFDASGTSAVDAARIPDITPSLSVSRSGSQYNYSPDPLVVGGARLGSLIYYKKAFGDAYQHVGTIDTDVATAEVQSDAVTSAMKSLGYKIVYSRTANPFETDFLTDVLRMQQDGVQMVYIVGLAVNQVADLAQNMAQQGFKPKVFSTNGVAYDSSYIKLAGTAANGTMTDQQSAMYLGQDARTVPAVALFDKWVHHVSKSAHYDTYGVYGWTAAELFVQALKAAGPHPTRAGLLAALNKITSFDGGGLLADGDPAQKVPEKCWIMVKVVNGHWQRVAPSPKTGFRCKPGGYHYPAGYHPFVRHN